MFGMTVTRVERCGCFAMCLVATCCVFCAGGTYKTEIMCFFIGTVLVAFELVYL